MRFSFWIRFFVLFLYVFAFEWIFHGMILGQTYRDTAHLWRLPDDLNNHFGWMMAGQAAFALVFCVLFNKSWRGGRSIGGVKWGALVGILFAAHQIIMYAVAPYPGGLVTAWIIGNIIECACAGFILAKMHKMQHAG